MKIKTALATVALLAFASMAQAQSVDKAKYQAKTLPAAGTAEEADMCAVATVNVLIAANNKEGFDPALKETITKIAAYWVDKSAKAHGKALEGYMSSDPFIDAAFAVNDVPMETHIDLLTQCAGRMP